jgi:hypothetical protein
MIVNFMNVNRDGSAVANPDASLVADENRAKAILESMFFNNITLTFNIGLGFVPPESGFPAVDVTGAGATLTNRETNVFVTYAANPNTGLRDALLNRGQPNFFTAANLPAGNSVITNPGAQNPFGISNFWITSSQAKALGFPPRGQGPDGFIGVSTTIAGDDRVATILHEVGHAMGRVPSTDINNLLTQYPLLNLVRFFRAGNSVNRVIIPGPLGYFSLDGGTTPLVNWGLEPGGAADFRTPAIVPGVPGDPFNEISRTGIGNNTPPALTTLDFQVMDFLGFTSPVKNPAPPAATSAVMVLRGTVDPNNGTYVIYDLGNNALLSGGTLGRLGSDRDFVAVGRFNDGDTSDILLRARTPDGTFQVYDVMGNTIQRTAVIGAVGLNWQPLAFGAFGGIAGNSDMIVRDTNAAGGGKMLIYNISNNLIRSSAEIGAVGLDWNFSGVGNFSSTVAGEADLLLRNTNAASSTPGQFQIYDISNNMLIPAPTPGGAGRVGLNWQFSGIGNFSSNPGESDLLLRDTDLASPTAGQLQLYDIVNNTITPVPGPLTTIPLAWQFAGVAPILSATSSDLVVRNVNTGAFQVYNIGSNRLLGPAITLNVPVDTTWQVGGFAVDPPNGPPDPSASTSQLVQASAGDPSNTIDGNTVGSPVDPSSFSSAMANPAPPDATTADMVLRNASNPAATYQIYNLGANSTLATNSLGQVGSEWGFVALGNFNLTDPSDMLLRNSTSGEFRAYEIVDNNVISSNSMGAVGSNWQVMGFGIFGPFSGVGETDMMLRNANTGDLQVYDIFDNEIVDSVPMGAVGLEWQFSGIGNFGSSGTSDMLLRNSNTGDLEVDNIIDNQVYDTASLGMIDLAWQFSGVGNFSSVPDESDLLLRNSNTGGLEVLNISNNQVTGGPTFLGTVGLEWQFAGVAPVHDATSSDLVLRNVNTGAFQVYNIANNQLMGSASLGAVGVASQVGGFAAIGSVVPPLIQDAPPEMGGSTAQLVQAMAGFGGSGAAISNIAPLGTEASQQPLLTTPQHG